MISLAGSLPLNWPPVLETMFEWCNIISSAGSNLLIPDCELTAMRTADAFYYKQIFYAFVPPLVALLCLASWLCIWKCGKSCRSEKNMTWPRVKDVTILSIVLLLFLCYPLLTRLALSAHSKSISRLSSRMGRI